MGDNMNDVEQSEKFRKHLSNVFGFEMPSFTLKPTFYYDMYKMGLICSGDDASKKMLDNQPVSSICKDYFEKLIKPVDLG